MWLDSLKAAGYSTNTLNTRRCQMSALSRALEGDPRDVEGDDLLAHFAAKDWKPETRKGAKNACVLLQCLFDRFGSVFPQCGLMVFPGVVIVSR